MSLPEERTIPAAGPSSCRRRSNHRLGAVFCESAFQFASALLRPACRFGERPTNPERQTAYWNCRLRHGRWLIWSRPESRDFPLAAALPLLAVRFSEAVLESPWAAPGRPPPRTFSFWASLGRPSAHCVFGANPSVGAFHQLPRGRSNGKSSRRPLFGPPASARPSTESGSRPLPRPSGPRT